jgi:hypothetical protein
MTQHHLASIRRYPAVCGRQLVAMTRRKFMQLSRGRMCLVPRGSVIENRIQKTEVSRLLLAQRSCAKRVARGVTSGSPRSASIRALEVRGEFFARLQRAVIVREVIQTFHVWLPSARRCRGELKTRNPKLKTSLRPALHA